MLINADTLSTDPVELVAEAIGLPRVGMGFIHGPSRHAKSLVTNNELGLAIANGTEFFGKPTVHGSVALCLGEGLYDAGIRKQARLSREQKDRLEQAGQIAADQGSAAAQAWLDEQPPFTDERLFVMTRPFPVPVRSEGQLTQELTRAITELRQIPDLELVILDTVSNFTGGLSISNDASANRFLLGMEAMMSALDCCVLGVTHSKSDGSGMNGSQRLFNGADFVIAVKPESGAPVTPGGSPTGAVLVSEKNKFGEPFEPLGYKIEPCAWHEPARDPETDELIPGTPPRLVTSATVRLSTDDDSDTSLRMPGTGRPRQAPPLPQIVEVNAERASKRSGLRRSTRPATFRSQAASERSEDPDVTARTGLVAALLSGTCPETDCGKTAGVSCNPGTGAAYTVLAMQPLVVAHTARVQERLSAGATDETALSAQFQPGDRFLAELRN